MSYVSAIGFSVSIGVEYNLVISAVPFLLLGLGIDDTFIILGAFRKTDVRDSVQDRVGSAMATAGSTIFVTSVTDFVAFLLTMFTDIPALVAFSVYSSAGIFFTFVYQVQCITGAVFGLGGHPAGSCVMHDAIFHHVALCHAVPCFVSYHAISHHAASYHGHFVKSCALGNVGIGLYFLLCPDHNVLWH